MNTDQNKQNETKFKKPIKITLILVLSLLVLIVISLAVAPNIVKTQLEKHGKEWVGRNLKINDLSVNYFTSTIKLNKAVMFEENGKDPFVALDSLILDLDLLKYFSSEVVVEELSVKNLKVNIAQKDSVFNFDDLVAFYNTENHTDTIPQNNEEALLFSLSNLKLDGGTLMYNDQNRNVTQVLENLSFFLPHIEWGRGSSKMGISFKFNEKGRFDINSEFNSQNGDYQFHVNVDSLDMSPFKPYTKDYLNVGGIKGIASGNIDIAGNINTLDTLNITGLTIFEDFALLDSLGQSFLGAQKVVCPLEMIEPMKSVYRLGDIRLTAPNVSFELYKDSNNFYRSFGLDSPEADMSTENHQEAPLVYSVKSLSLEQGTFRLKDYTTRWPFVYDFSDMKMDFGSINNSSKWIDGKMSMVLNKRGQLEANVGFNPNDAAMNMKVDYVISNFQLGDLNIYSMEYTGYPILYGDMYYKGVIDIDKGNLNLENKLTVHNAEIGNKKGSGFYNLPIKLALFILKDKDGVINMDIPVTGNLNDPKINIRKIIWKTFGNFLVKTVTSPFRALSNLISVDPSDIKEINYTYMDTTLVSSKERQLKLLRKLETSKPNLDIELVYFNDKRKQREEIAKQLEIEDELKTDSIANLFDNVCIKSIKTYLSEKFGDSTRIKVTVPAKFNPKNRGSQPVFEVKYKMQGATEEDNALE